MIYQVEFENSDIQKAEDMATKRGGGTTRNEIIRLALKEYLEKNKK